MQNEQQHYERDFRQFLADERACYSPVSVAEEAGGEPVPGKGFTLTSEGEDIFALRPTIAEGAA